MTTRELYSSIGGSGYEHQACWRKGGIFHIRMEAPQSCHKCPKCGDRNVIHRGTFDRMVHAPRIRQLGTQHYHIKRRGEIEFPDANDAENLLGEGRGAPTGFQF